MSTNEKACLITIDAIPDCEDYYAAEYRKDFDKNMRERVLKKTAIATWLEKYQRYGFTEEQVKDEINRSSMFACEFIKDPMQQSCYERYCREYITKYSPAVCEKLVSTKSKNALYVYEGKLYSYPELPEIARTLVKSIDFKITYNGYTIYASHKHTRKDGGNQNNQWHDLISFGQHARLSTDSKVIFIALADGEYYTRTKKKSKTKMELLNELANDHFMAMTTTEFCRWIYTLQ